MPHCNRCGQETSLYPEAPPPDADPSLLRAFVEGGEDSLTAFQVCGECLGRGGPYRYCARCGQETPASDLLGGYCSWCRAVESVPFEEAGD